MHDARGFEPGLVHGLLGTLPPFVAAIALLLLVATSIIKLWKSRGWPQALMVIGSITFAVMAVLCWYQYELFSSKTPDGENRWILHLGSGWLFLRNTLTPASGALFGAGYLWETWKSSAEPRVQRE